ncbi:chloramphenicol acetyltransferase [Dysgonomonas macrotermitis]|uniref:Chloramphenicol O-acetyltransferase type A n=1 Tax=Dysgonomonas macrotermitis TaxID=1346286 RepID=A0A1M5HHT3_9BACT|nr:chloramphenicol acetyltransferase [Dysgonomonas macrotermitis]SHG15402.1 chloramphenicol O-acetyltransferase type A [Dysgonomonas macrotermitis]
MRQKIDIDKWNRKGHYLLFKNFDEPYHGICIRIDCTKAYKRSKELGTSFFLYYLHKCTMAVNAIDAFHYRIEGNEVYRYDSIHPESTVDRPDGSFGFCHMDYYEDFALFQEEARKNIEEVRQNDSLTPGININAIHYSAVPWIDFTSLSHASNFRHDAVGCPKISFGKMSEVNGLRSMPVSIHVHHSLIDGRELGAFIDEFQRLMDE